MSSWFGKLKKSAVVAKDRIRAAGADIIDSTQSKLAGKIFRVAGVRYKVKKLIAEGGFGYVYLVEDETTGQLFALKQMMLQTREAIEVTNREVKLLQELPKSPYLVKLIGAESVKGTPDEALIVMEYCSGGNLADIINADGIQGRGLPENQIWDIFYEVCEAVAHLHEMSPIAIHRDIKAENILIGNDGFHKLCDFGSVTREMVFPSNELERSNIGDDLDRYTTLVYRAPEMVDLYLEKWISDKSDIWALGCLLYKMAYILTPFEEQGKLGILNANVEFPTSGVNANSYSENFKKMILWLLTPDPDIRPNIYDVLERVCSMRGGAYNRNGKIPPRTPQHSSASARANTNNTSNSKPSSQGILNALDWQTTSDSSTSHHAQPSFGGFVSSPNQTPSFGTPDFFSSPSPSLDAWDPFGTQSPATPQHTTPAFSNSFSPLGEDPFNTTFQTQPQTSFEQFERAAQQNLTNSSSNPQIQTTAQPPQLVVTQEPFIPIRHHQKHQQPTNSNNLHVNTSSSRGHRRSVSDSSALVAQLEAANIRQPSGPAASQSASNVQTNTKLNDSIIPGLVGNLLNPSSSILPSVLNYWYLLTCTWAQPQQPNVTKTFKGIAPKLKESPTVCLKGLYIVHRLLREGSPPVLALCINKMEFWKKVLSDLEGNISNSSSTNLTYNIISSKYVLYLLKKLEFHQNFDGNFEGSYSLDLYFAKLRAEGKKLSIGGSDSPLRRQVVTSLLELNTSLLNVLEYIINLNLQSVDLLLCVTAIPLLTDAYSIFLLLQYTITKLLATKTDFSKVLVQYEEQYRKMYNLFTNYSSITQNPLVESTFTTNVVLPTLPVIPPEIVKGRIVPYPPSLNVDLVADPKRIPQSIISDPVSVEELQQGNAFWESYVHPSTASRAHPDNYMQPSGGSDTTLNTSNFTPISSGTNTPLNVSSGYGHENSQLNSQNGFSNILSMSSSSAFSEGSVITPNVGMSNSPGSLSASGSFSSSFDPFSPVPQSSSPGIPLNHNMGQTPNHFTSGGGFTVGDPFLTTPNSAPISFEEFTGPNANSPTFSIGHKENSGSSPSEPKLAKPKSKPSKSHARGKSDKTGFSHSSSSSSTAQDGGWASTSEDKLKKDAELSEQAEIMKQIYALPGNKYCCECGDTAPRWVSVNLGILLCYRCSGIHRSLGTDISKVRSSNLDVLTQKQISTLMSLGNARSNEIWLANVPDSRIPPNRGSSQGDLEKWIRDKYVYEEFKAK